MNSLKSLTLRLLLTAGMAVVTFNSYSQNDPLANESITVNGIKWATCNMNMPGVFAANPEDVGMLYQWNRNVAYPATGNVIDWDRTIPKGVAWEKENDPCPAGWRMPARNDFEKLLDPDMVNSELTAVNAIEGRMFTDKETGSSVFFPATGYRESNNRVLRTGDGFYWSSTQYDNDSAYNLGFATGGTKWTGCYNNARELGFSIRCVAE